MSVFGNKFGAPQPPVQHGAPPQGYGPGQAPPPAAGGYGGPPQGYGAPAPAGARFGGLTLNPSTPNIPLGDHVLECTGHEFANPSSGPLFIIHFKVDESNAAPVGSTCAWKRTMVVNAKGGTQIVFSSIAKTLLPLLGVDLNDLQAQQAALAELDQYWTEFEARGTLNGQSLVGLKVRCHGQQGKPNPKGGFYTDTFFAPAAA